MTPCPSLITGSPRTGRKFIGIEKDPKHFATALARIERELTQPCMMFAPAAPKQTSTDMFGHVTTRK